MQRPSLPCAEARCVRYAWYDAGHAALAADVYGASVSKCMREPDGQKRGCEEQRLGVTGGCPSGGLPPSMHGWCILAQVQSHHHKAHACHKQRQHTTEYQTELLMATSLCVDVLDKSGSEHNAAGMPAALHTAAVHIAGLHIAGLHIAALYI